MSTKVRNYTDKELLDRVKSLSNFKHIPNNYWIIGVRSQEDTANVFDDKFYLFKGEEHIATSSGTTNPGSPALINGWKKVNKKGAFILKSDYWHYGIWRGGMHKKKLKALVQVGIATGYRDGNNNDKSEEIGEMYKEEWKGINFHLNTYNLLQKLKNWIIGAWSYGCQVSNDTEKYNIFIEKCYDQKYTDYVLLKEWD